jgi:hypothetical protein
MTFQHTENLIAQAEKDLADLWKSHAVIADAKHEIERSMIDLDAKKKDLSMAISKSRQSIREKEFEIKDLTRKFWTEKRGY